MPNAQRGCHADHGWLTFRLLLNGKSTFNSFKPRLWVRVLNSRIRELLAGALSGVLQLCVLSARPGCQAKGREPQDLTLGLSVQDGGTGLYGGHRQERRKPGAGNRGRPRARASVVLRPRTRRPGGAPRGKRTRGEREMDVLAPSLRSVRLSQPTFYFPALIRDK